VLASKAISSQPGTPILVAVVNNAKRKPTGSTTLPTKRNEMLTTEITINAIKRNGFNTYQGGTNEYDN
jgi:hypothetical protein